jgi:hypothetical protein
MLPAGWGHSVVAVAAFVEIAQGLNAKLQIRQIAQLLLAGYILGGQTLMALLQGIQRLPPRQQ